MAKHKLTSLGDPARKRIQIYLQRNQGLHAEVYRTEERITSRRLACADGVVAISGQPGVDLANDLYDVNLASENLLERFHAMLRNHDYEQALPRPADVCAEGHLWMTLTGLHLRNYNADGQQPRHLHRHPRHLHAWVYQIDSNNRPKEDSPCQNCRQWVRAEFLSLNGTS